MTRPSLLSLGLIALIGFSGCSAVEAQRYPTQRRGGTVYQTPQRPVDYRSDRGRSAPFSSRRIEQDVRRYVSVLDRELRLDNRQERRLREILENRTYHHLRNMRRNEARRAYPFPRRLGQNRFDNRRVRDFWRSTDGRIERELDRYQKQDYQYLTGKRRNRPSRYRDDGDRHRNDRYRNERARDRDDRRDDRREDRRRGRRGNDD